MSNGRRRTGKVSLGSARKVSPRCFKAFPTVFTRLYDIGVFDVAFWSIDGKPRVNIDGPLKECSPSNILNCSAPALCRIFFSARRFLRTCHCDVLPGTRERKDMGPVKDG
jgi:hypothetical protein